MYHLILAEFIASICVDSTHPKSPEPAPGNLTLFFSFFFIYFAGWIQVGTSVNLNNKWVGFRLNPLLLYDPPT